MFLVGDFSTVAGPLVIARESLWLTSIGIGMVGFLFELFSPEKKWKRFRWWRKQGNIKLDEDEEEDEEEEGDDGVEGLNGGGAVPGKTEYGDLESPVLTANVYERSVAQPI